MEYQEQAEQASLGCWNHRVEDHLDLHRIGLIGYGESSGQTTDMRVDGKAWQVEGHASNDVRRLASDSG